MISESDVLQRLKSRGYWEIEIRPTVYKQDRLSFPKCREIVESCQVRLRGWYYPHIPQHEFGEVFTGDDFVEGLVDSPKHCEVWRMYRSGQFIHYLNFWEDWIGYSPYNYEVVTDREYKLPNVKEILMTLYTVTEIFTFASRLASNKLFDKRLHISLKLNNTNNRSLIFGESSFQRALYEDYNCKINEMNIERDLLVDDVLKNFPQLAMDVVEEIFHKFNWHSKDIKSVLKNDQEEFLKGLV